MKKFLFLLLIISVFGSDFAFAKADSVTINLVRYFSRDIFGNNGTAYLKPMVEGINATSNSSFFSTAYVPKKVKKPYFKFGLHGMIGVVPSDMKTYTPNIPTEQFSLSELNKYMTFEWINGSPQITAIPDTAALAYYALKTILYDAVQAGDITVPTTSATVLGSENKNLYISNEVLRETMKKSPAYAFLPQNFRDTLDKYIGQFPESFSLPKGANMNVFGAGIPQLEIGSLYGTEALIRFFPPVDMGENIGDFAFWGFGLKHSISQYFTTYKPGYDTATSYESRQELEDTPFDLSIQAVYQGTSLKNKIGVTEADLDANATFWDFNLQFSKRIKNWINIYTGISYEHVSIDADYTYAIPWEMQIQLGMVTKKLDAQGNPLIDPATGWPIYETNEEYPGDTQPQTSKIKIKDTNWKWIFGLSKDIGRFTIFADYNFSTFGIFSGGISYRF